jgi:hypothetical protein
MLIKIELIFIHTTIVSKVNKARQNKTINYG